MRVPLFVIGIAAAPLACGGPTVDPASTAVSAAARRLARADLRAGEAAWAEPGYATRLRHNPGDCACPPWEIQMTGRWVRVEARPADPNAPEHLALLVADGAERDVWLNLTRDIVGSESGWNYRVVEVAPPPNAD